MHEIICFSRKPEKILDFTSKFRLGLVTLNTCFFSFVLTLSLGFVLLQDNATVPRTVLQTVLLGLSGTMAPALLAPRENSKYHRVPWF